MDNTSKVGTSKVGSLALDTINRIEKKLESLSSILEPITLSIPGNIKEGQSSTQLHNGLQNIEDKITTLLDTISL